MGRTKGSKNKPKNTVTIDTTPKVIDKVIVTTPQHYTDIPELHEKLTVEWNDGEWKCYGEGSFTMKYGRSEIVAVAEYVLNRMKEVK